MELMLYLLVTKKGLWKIRIDPPNTSVKNSKKHIHLHHKEMKKNEYSWNIDGSRHDKHRFPENEQYIEKAKKLASEYLGIDKNILQFITYADNKEKLSIKQHKNILSNYYVKTNNIVCLFATDKGLIVIEIEK